VNIEPSPRREPGSKLERELAIIYCRLNSYLHPLTATEQSGAEREWMMMTLSHDALRAICPADAISWVWNNEDDVWRGTKILNAYQVSKPIKGSVVDGFHFAFGIENEKVAAQLRHLADAIDSGTKVVTGDGNGHLDVIVERMTFESTAQRDDFTTSRITMIVAEKVKA
jgi:hypothetical protein